MVSKKELSNTPPDYLTKNARYMWRRLVPLLKENSITNSLDKTMIESFCINYHTLRMGYDSVAKDGVIYVTESGTIKKNPATQVIDLASKNLRAIGAELGLTPMSRAKLLESADDDGDSTSAIEAVKKGGFIK